MRRVRVQVRAQLGQAHARPDRAAVAHHVQVVAAEVDDPRAARVGDPGVADVPLLRHDPVEHRGAARHLADLERDEILQAPERRAHALAGDRAADRVELGDAAVQHRADVRRRAGVGGHQASTSTCGSGTTKRPPQLADRRHARHDLVADVPGQDQHVVGPGLQDPLRRVHRDAGAGQEPPLLVRADVDRVVEQIGLDAAEVQERVALGRRAVADHGLAGLAGLHQEAQQRALAAVDLLGEVAVARRASSGPRRSRARATPRPAARPGARRRPRRAGRRCAASRPAARSPRRRTARARAGRRSFRR